jgi:hypothetical protein
MSNRTINAKPKKRVSNECFGFAFTVLLRTKSGRRRRRCTEEAAKEEEAKAPRAVCLITSWSVIKIIRCDLMRSVTRRKSGSRPFDESPSATRKREREEES